MSHIQPDTHLPKTTKVKVYSANMTQTGTNAPVATILQNTLGTVTWARAAVGQYTGTTAGLLTAGKTWLIINKNSSQAAVVQQLVRTGTNAVEIRTTSSGTPGDDGLGDTSIEIRVYE